MNKYKICRFTLFINITHVISLPPLSFGAFQDSVTEPAVMSSYASGPSGGPGRSVFFFS